MQDTATLFLVKLWIGGLGHSNAKTARRALQFLRSACFMLEGQQSENGRGIRCDPLQDVVEEEMLAEPDVKEAVPGYDDEARTRYAG